MHYAYDNNMKTLIHQGSVNNNIMVLLVHLYKVQIIIIYLYKFKVSY